MVLPFPRFDSVLSTRFRFRLHDDAFFVMHVMCVGRHSHLNAVSPGAVFSFYYWCDTVFSFGCRHYVFGRAWEGAYTHL